MKFSARDGAAYLRKPDTSVLAVLLFGQDKMRVALKRQDLVLALAGAEASEEMRLTRLQASDVRKDPASLSDALRAQGFFPGTRVVVLEDATDTVWDAISTALADQTDADARLIVTAGALTPRSRMRKGFETSGNAVAIGIYEDPMSRDAIEALLQKAGIADVPRDVMDGLLAFGHSLDPGDFAQLVEKLALYSMGGDGGVTTEALEAVAPATQETGVDAAIEEAADGKVSALVVSLRRLSAQGSAPTTLCIAARRHFRTLHAIAASPRGIDSALSGLRPPVFGPRRDRLSRQARHWPVHKLEEILSLLHDTDLKLRSSSAAPANAALERAFIRIAMLH